MNAFILLIGRETDPDIEEIIHSLNQYDDYSLLEESLNRIEIQHLTTPLFRRYFSITTGLGRIIRTAELYGLFCQTDRELDPDILREQVARHFYNALSREDVIGHIQIVPHFYGCDYLTIFDYVDGDFSKGSNVSLNTPDMKLIDKLIEEAMGWEDDLTFRTKVYLQASEDL